MAERWQPLQDGDIVDIIAPGFKVDPQVLESAIEFVKSWNLVPRVPKKLFNKHFLFSNDDEARIEHLRSAILAKDSKVVWCLRGGYGSIRLLPALSKIKKPKTAKLLVGISDITSLHNYLNQHWGWSTLHAALLDRMGQGKVPPKIQKEMKALLWGKSKQVVFPRLKPLNEAAKKVSKLSSTVVGGNMITLQSSLGTPYDFSLKNHFLFLEDIGERGYKIDRVMNHFEQAGKLKGCKGVLFGHFTGGDEPAGGNHVNRTLHHWAQSTSIPAFSGVESGHDVNLRPLPFLTRAQIIKDKNFKLVIDTGVQAL